MFSVNCPNSNKNFFFTTCLGETSQQVKLLCNWLDNQDTGVWFLTWQEIFLFSKASRPYVGSIQPSVHLVPQALSPEGKLLRHHADHSSPSIANLELYIHCHVWFHSIQRDTFICTTTPKKGSGAHSPSYPVGTGVTWLWIKWWHNQFQLLLSNASKVAHKFKKTSQHTDWQHHSAAWQRLSQHGP